LFEYSQYNRYFAQVGDGIDEIAADELEALGAREIKPVYRGLYFVCDAPALYRINYMSRLVTRVLAPLMTFDCHSAKYLYKRASEIEWPKLFTTEQTFAVFANVSNSAIRHSQYAALRVKDAVADRFRADCGRRPNVKPIDPDVSLALYISNNKATISIDTSGGSLHRRGYRKGSVEAPIQETVAAAIVRFSGWNAERPLVDPMCGSGTLLAEALMHGSRIPAGFLRPRFGFEALPDFDAGVWQAVKSEADRGIEPLPSGLITGGDIDGKAVAAARANLANLPGGKSIDVSRRRYEDIDAISGTTILCNPPYGLRLGRADAMPQFAKSLGDFLKQRCTGSEAYIYFGRREVLKSLGLRSTWKKPLPSGGLDGRLVKYELY